MFPVPKKLRSPVRRATTLRTWLRCEQLEDRLTPSAAAPPTYFFVHQSDTAATGAAPLASAFQYLSEHAGQFGLTQADLADAIVTDLYRDADTGITHIYLRQSANGLAVENANINLAVADDGRVLSAAGGFVADLASRLPAGTPALSASEAVIRAAAALGVTLSGQPVMTETLGGVAAVTVFSAPELSLDAITARLHYMATDDGGVALGWQMVVRTADLDHWYDLSIDGATGAMNSLSDWVSDATYNVIAAPAESYQDGGFTILTDPHDTTASPFGWHDTDGVAGAEFTDTRGNNVDAHLDRVNDNIPDGVRPDGGAALDFSGFTFDPTQAPTSATNSLISQLNLFYAINRIHDVSYQYGFTEAAGNFQVNNYGRGGAGGDAVQADALDGGGTNNANFGTPPDGSAPRMQQYIWTITNPDRDSSLDNGVVYHEFGHGISNRLTGGPANSNALNATQSGGMGEGWSDFYALMLTQRSTDLPGGRYGIGTYVIGQGLNGTGIRSFPYSYDMAINPMTFADYGTGAGQSTAVHFAGARWASALWDIDMLLCQKYGFDGDLSTGWSAGGTGNKLALQLVTEGLKLQPALPTFLQARDAILAADIALNGGRDQAELWTAFARRGLGYLASTSGPNSTAITEDYGVPSGISIQPTATITEGDSGTSTLTFTVTLSAANSRNVTVNYATAGVTATVADGDYQPASGTLTFTPGQTTRTFTVTVNGDTRFELDETFRINLSAPVNGYFITGDNLSTATILNDDAPPVIGVSGASVLEGHTGTRTVTFTVSLNTASGLPATVNYTTANGSATAGSDYTATSGSLTFNPGQTTRTVNVTISGDTLFELDETIALQLSGAGNATIGTPSAIATILNDDLPPSFAVTGGTVVEGNTGSQTITFTVALNVLSGVTATVDFATVDGLALAGADYVGTSGTLTFNPGTTTQTVTVTVTGDTLFELDESFSLQLSNPTFATVSTASAAGIITNDDLAPLVGVVGGSVLEGNAGSSPLAFTLVLSAAAGTDVTVSYSTLPGTALILSDYLGQSGTVTFAAGIISRTIFVTVLGDVFFEQPETVLIRAVGPRNTSVGSGTILNDDEIPVRIAVGSSAGEPARVVVLDYAGAIKFVLDPFDGFTGGVTVATARINADQIPDIIVGAGPGAGPHVKIYDGVTGAELASFMAFGPEFFGGVNVAAGDLNGDGRADIIVGAGPGAGPHVKVFDGASLTEILSFFAYDSGFKGGVTVAVGDLDGDGSVEIVTGMGEGGAGLVKAYRGSDAAEIYRFLAYAPGFKGGVSVAVGDLDGDGIAEIITGAGTGNGPHVKVFRGADAAQYGSFFAYDRGFQGGITVAAHDLNGDGIDEIVVGSGPGGGPHVKAFRGFQGLEFFSLLAGDEGTGGIRVG